MRIELKLSSFKLWRERAQERSTKHLKKSEMERFCFNCSRQGAINNNKISKR
mgnify:CR=1|tara:strand:- start:1039 stop:1194 length:156 start_codon:yes stop_codon:yes gene_type:complete